MGRKLYALMLAALMILAPAMLAVSAFAQQQPVVITIGALLPLTGDLQSYGVRAQAAVEFAVQEMNQYLEQKNAPFRINITVEDTQTKPDVAQQKFNALVSQGIKIIVGPMTSAEVKKLKDAADQHNVLLISPSSTAVELAIPGDNVFRFCPADDVQSKVIGEVAKEDGIKAVLMVVRADTWGKGLADATEDVLKSNGIKVLLREEYNPENPQFSVVAGKLADALQKAAKEGYNRNEVGIIAIGFKEVKDLFKEAKGYPILGQVPWFGSDGTALLTEISGDPDAAQFSEQTLFINPIFSPATTQETQKVNQYVVQKTGSNADAYSLAAHDIVVAVTLAILNNGTQYLNDPDALVNAVKQALPNVVQSQEFAQFAATGTFPLNDAGDRATADYDLWIIMKNSTTGKYEWTKVGKYIGNQNTITWETLPNGKTYPDMYKATFTGPIKTGGVGGTAVIAGIIIVIIIIIAALLLRRKPSA
ncbi:MAG: penicillin-binding protein activator [Desulfurococcales archaeon]|nr:penicillin-binding protein activator [Desulfurococcales archaeon]